MPSNSISAMRKRAPSSILKVSPTAVAAWQARDEAALHRALGLKPWDFSPLDVDDGECPYPGFPQNENWQRANDLRAALEAAAHGDLRDPEEV